MPRMRPGQRRPFVPKTPAQQQAFLQNQAEIMAAQQAAMQNVPQNERPTTQRGISALQNQYRQQQANAAPQQGTQIPTQGAQGQTPGMSFQNFPQPSWSEWAFGTTPKLAHFEQFQPSQQNIFKLLEEQLPGVLGRAAQTGTFEPIALQEIKRYKEQILPLIQGQFAGGGLTSTGAYTKAQQDSAVDLGARLASLGQQFKQGETAQAQNLLGLLTGKTLTPRFETSILGAQPGYVQSIFGPQNMQQIGGLAATLAKIAPYL